MSDHSTASKGPKQLIVTGLFSFLIPILIIGGLVYTYMSGGQSTAVSANPEKAVAQRIQKIGSVEIGDANREARTGEQVFNAQCTACHTAGVAGAPKFGDAGAWGPRIATGFETLLNSALKGKNAMGAQGGGDFSDFEVARAVVYMANAGGAKFAEPKKPEAAK
jgi:cytochrome c5